MEPVSPTERRAYFLQKRRITALRSATQNIVQAVEQIAPPGCQRDPTAAVTRSISIATQQIQTRLATTLYLLYFIINATIRKVLFTSNPTALPSREDIYISFHRCARLPLAESTITIVVTYCLNTFPAVTDLRMAFTLANRILDLAGWKLACTQCGQRFRKRERVNEHSDSGHDRVCFQLCSFQDCTELLPDLASLIRHHQEVHLGGPIWQQNVVFAQMLQNEGIRLASAPQPNLPSTAAISNVSSGPGRFNGGQPSPRNQQSQLSTPPQSINGSHHLENAASQSSMPNPSPSDILDALSDIPALTPPPPGSFSPHLSPSVSETPDLPEKMDINFLIDNENHPFGTGEF